MSFDLDGFCERYLGEWEQRSTVRRAPRSRFSGEALAGDLFPAAMAPVLHHPAVARLDADAKRLFLTCMAYDFQGGVADIEVDLVADLCGRLAGAELGIELPRSARQVALTIGTDEFYHAYAAREFVDDVRRHTGIEPTPMQSAEEPVCLAVAYVRDTAPAELRSLAETMALCFAENVITEELFGMSRDTPAGSPFHVVVREHLVDEGRHQTYFQTLMRHIWREVGEETRRALGRLLPGFLDIFLCDPAFYVERQTLHLGRLGFDGETGRRIVGEAYAALMPVLPPGEPRPPKSAMKFAALPMNLVNVAGFLDHAPTRALLVESRWLAA